MVRRFWTGMSVVLLGALALLALLIPMSSDREIPENAPSESSLARAALDGGLTDDPNATRCVARLIRHSSLSLESMQAISQNPSNWIIKDGAERDKFTVDVEELMATHCGVDPWPAVDSWPDDPGRS